MSWHDLVSAQISNVCMTRHVALNAIAYIVCVKQFVMFQQFPRETGSLCAERMGQGEVGWYIHPKGENRWLCVGLAVKITQQGHCTNSPGKWSSHLTGPPCSVQVC